MRENCVQKLKLLKTEMKAGRNETIAKIYTLVSEFYINLEEKFRSGLDKIGSAADKTSDDILTLLQNFQEIESADPDLACLTGYLKDLFRTKFVSIRQVTNLAQSILVEYGLDMKKP